MKLTPAYSALWLAGKSLAWLVAGLLAPAFLFSLPLRKPDAFNALVLRLALLSISIAFLAVALNLVQRLANERQEQRLRRLYEEAKQAIGALLKSPRDQQCRQVLRSYLGQLEALKRASESLSDADGETLRQALIELGTGSHLEQQARRGRRKWRRIQALFLLGWLKPAASVPLLQRSLYDPDPDVAYAAAKALAEYDLEAAYRALLDALDRAPISRSRLAAFLESSRCPRAVALLCERASDPSPEGRFWVAYLLGQTRDRQALPALLALARDPDANVRANAAEAIGRLGDRRKTTPAIKRLLRDSEWIVRAHAAKAAGALGDKRLIQELVSLLRDQQWWVRQNSALALERIGPPAIPYLAAMLSDPDRFARNKAAEVLGRLGVISDQIAKLSGPRQEAEAARDLLLAICRAEAVGIIEEEALSADPVTQSRLVYILGEVADISLLPLLEQLSQSKVPQVRERAERAIARIRSAA